MAAGKFAASNLSLDGVLAVSDFVAPNIIWMLTSFVWWVGLHSDFRWNGTENWSIFYQVQSVPFDQIRIFTSIENGKILGPILAIYGQKSTRWVQKSVKFWLGSIDSIRPDLNIYLNYKWQHFGQIRSNFDQVQTIPFNEIWISGPIKTCKILGLIWLIFGVGWWTNYEIATGNRRDEEVPKWRSKRRLKFGNSQIKWAAVVRLVKFST